MIENEKIEEMMFELEEKCENTLNALERDYGAIRTGRANPRILDRLEVEAYGGMSKLVELGNVSALDAKCLQISLWDKSLLKAVEKAILQSNILHGNARIADIVPNLMRKTNNLIKKLQRTKSNGHQRPKRALSFPPRQTPQPQNGAMDGLQISGAGGLGIQAFFRSQASSYSGNPDVSGRRR